MRIFITEEERKEAFYELSFNRWKALKLFSFCFASCIVGLTAMYWTLDYTYEKRLETLTTNLLNEMETEVSNAQMHPVSGLYDGVVSFRGRADFDNVSIINPLTPKYIKEHPLTKVRGERRAVAEGIYQIRFTTTSEEPLPVKPLAGAE